MFTRYTTTQFLATVANTSLSSSTQAWLDDFTLTPLSTTYAYDWPEIWRRYAGRTAAAPGCIETAGPGWWPGKTAWTAHYRRL